MLQSIESLQPAQSSIIALLVLCITALLYVCGNSREHWLKQSAFWLGLLTYYLVSVTRFDYLAQHQFYIHRLQHTALHHVAPLFIALSHPARRLVTGLPQVMRQWLTAVKARPLWIVLTTIMNAPSVAVILFCGLIGLWLIPSVHFVAMLDARLYQLMNWSMAINGLMFWSLVLNDELQPAKRIAMLLAIVPPQVVLGLLLVWSSHDFYPIYDVCGRLLGASPLVDQQLGGVILWLSGGMMSVVGILVSARRRRA